MPDDEKTLYPESEQPPVEPTPVEPGLGEVVHDSGHLQSAVDPTEQGTAMPEAEPPQAEPEPTGAELLKGILSPEMHAQLMQDAKGEISLTEALSLGGLAAANPAMAQQVIQQRGAKAINAKNVLAQLQANAVAFQKTLELEKGRDIRHEERLANQEYAQMLSHLEPRLTAVQKEVAGTEIEPFVYPPKEEGPAALQEAAAKYLSYATPLMEEKKRVVQEAKIISDWSKNTLQAAKLGEAPPKELQVQQLIGLGIPEEKARKTVSDVYPGIASAQQYTRTLLNNNKEAHTEALKALRDVRDRTAERIQAYLDEGSLEHKRLAVQELSSLRSLHATYATQRQKAHENFQIWMDPAYAGTEIQRKEVAYWKGQEDSLASEMMSIQSLIRDQASKLLPIANQLDMSETYIIAFDRATENLIGGHEELLQEDYPALSGIPPGYDRVMYISGAPSAYLGPEERKLKQEFWEDLMTTVRANFPNVSLKQVRDMLEEEARNRLMSAAGPKPPAFQAGEVLSPTEEMPWWLQAAPEVEAQVPLKGTFFSRVWELANIPDFFSTPVPIDYQGIPPAEAPPSAPTEEPTGE